MSQETEAIRQDQVSAPTQAQWARLRKALRAYFELVAGFVRASGIADVLSILMSPVGSLETSEIKGIASVLAAEPELRGAIYRDAAGEPVESFETHMVWNFLVGRLLSAYLAQAKGARL